MSQKTSGYVVTNGNTATTGYENNCCVTNSFPSMNYYTSKNGYSGSNVTYNNTKYKDGVFQR